MRRKLRSAGRGARAAMLVLVVLGPWLGTVAPAHAHGALRGSSPADGAHLTTAPRELRLTFNERVEIAVARLQLIGPDGAPVVLGPLRLAPDSSVVLVADVRGGLAAGEYTVAWQVASADGHPVRGRFRFVIAPGAQGLAPPLAAPQPAPTPSETRHDPVTLPTGGAFDAASPLYAGIRWLSFLGLLGTIGAVAFRLGVLPRAVRRMAARGPALASAAAAAAARIGLAASGAVGVAAVLRLYAQSVALRGAGEALDAGLVAAMLTRTVWGWGWLLQVAGVLVALAGFSRARATRGTAGEEHPGAGWALAAAGATVLAFTPALSGHAAAVPGIPVVAVLVDALHVLGAGGWLGGLLVLVAAGLPAAARVEEGDRRSAAAALVDGFSPTALACAALVTTTGLVTAGLHLGSIPALWQSPYGRTLLLKLAVLAAVFGTGAYNWLRVRPALGQGTGTERLRRTAALELVVGAVVLAVTAVLVATATPSATGST